MVITIKEKHQSEEVERLKEWIRKQGLDYQIFKGKNLYVMGVVGDASTIDEKLILAYDCVETVKRVMTPYKKVSRSFHPEDTIVTVGDLRIGGKEGIVMIGGPCSIEGLDSTLDIAKNVKAAGGRVLRGGAFKPRTSPYAFQGLKEVGIEAMVQARQQYGLPICSEVVAVEDVAFFEEHVDILQIGARNMQNFELLKAVGRGKKPVLLKRGLSATIEEWLMAAEYILKEGNPNVILCERGIRTFETMTRNTLDLSSVPLLKKITHLPVMVDPSHGTGKWDLVTPMSLAAIACGADGLIIEVHPSPKQAWSDGAQCLMYDAYQTLIDDCKKVATAIGRTIQ